MNKALSFNQFYAEIDEVYINIGIVISDTFDGDEINPLK